MTNDPRKKHSGSGGPGQFIKTGRTCAAEAVRPTISLWCAYPSLETAARAGLRGYSSGVSERVLASTQRTIRWPGQYSAAAVATHSSGR